MERFIKNTVSISDMTKDSELVREVEKFLEEKNIDILEMVYDRSITFDGKPTFEVLTNNPRALKNLSREYNVPLRNNYDTRSWYKVLDIQKDGSNLYIYLRDKSFKHLGNIRTCSRKR